MRKAYPVPSVTFRAMTSTPHLYRAVRRGNPEPRPTRRMSPPAAGCGGQSGHLVDLFDNLINEYSQDTNLADYPDVLLPADMRGDLRANAESLDENYGLSAIVESDEGTSSCFVPTRPRYDVVYNSSSSPPSPCALRLSQESRPVGSMDAPPDRLGGRLENLYLSTVF